jgi:DNA repair protein RadC
MSLSELPPEVRPRERMATLGPASLTDCELLAILLRTGLRGESVLHLSSRILKECSGLVGLMKADNAALAGVKGLGPSKRSMLLVVMELARRSLRGRLEEMPVFESAESVRTYLRMHFGALEAECFAVMFLDIRHRLIALETLFHGTLSHTIAYPREVVKRALALNAAAVILVHNHPSGHTDPSPEDVKLTHVMLQALSLVDVKVLDHFIVGAGDAVPLTDLGLL